jgi:hypothetical protein
VLLAETGQMIRKKVGVRDLFVLTDNMIAFFVIP